MTKNTMPTLDLIEVNTQNTINASIIWLHGLGGNGHDFEPLVPELKLPSDLGVRFIFPHAPHIPVTINQGMVMPAWYDIFALSLEREVDTKGLIQSANQVVELIEQEKTRGITSERIILAGFSQGGAVVYHAALSYPEKLGGLLPLSTYLATSEQITYHSANQSIPIHIMHGVFDSVVPEVLGQQAQKQLKARGYHLTYSTYPMQHNVCPEQVTHISQWLQTCLK